MLLAEEALCKQSIFVKKRPLFVFQIKLLESPNRKLVSSFPDLMPVDADPGHTPSDSFINWFLANAADSDDGIKIPCPDPASTLIASESPRFVWIANVRAFVNERSHDFSLPLLVRSSIMDAWQKHQQKNRVT
jgi:hypothetical protein